MAEETKNQEVNDSIESLLSSSASTESSTKNSEASDDIRETIKPLNIYNGINTTNPDLSTNKHSYNGGDGVGSRSPEPLHSSTKFAGPSRTLIDTAAPFQSVKAAVNMFGGNVDWMLQRTKERNKNFEQELEKAEQEVPLYLKQLEEAEDANIRVLEELEITKKQLEELKLQLDKTQTEQSQAQQDCELAQLRVIEIAQGIDKEDSVAAKAQVELAKTRHFEAANELKYVEAELETLKKECDQLIEQKDIAVKKAEEAVFASNEIEKKIEELTIDLISANQLKQSQEKLQSLEEKISFVNDLKLKLDTKSTILTSLKLELASYVETKLTQEADNEEAKKELEVVNASIQKAKDEVNCLRIAASSLKSELTKGKNQCESIEKLVTIPLEEYYSLNKKADVVEKLAIERVIAAINQIKDVKRTESMNKEKLEDSYKEIKEMKESLRDATEKADKAEEGKLKIENELREWNESEANASSKGQFLSSHHYWKSFDDSKDIDGSDPASIALRVNSTPNPKRCNSITKVSDSVPEVKLSKKKSFFPKLIMSLAAKKKTQPLN